MLHTANVSPYLTFVTLSEYRNGADDFYLCPPILAMEMRALTSTPSLDERSYYLIGGEDFHALLERKSEIC
eukprot:scaffold407437_cov21-Prasinocladus_malaysianus.AAC.1